MGVFEATKAQEDCNHRGAFVKSSGWNRSPPCSISWKLWSPHFEIMFGRFFPYFTNNYHPQDARGETIVAKHEPRLCQSKNVAWSFWIINRHIIAIPRVEVFKWWWRNTSPLCAVTWSAWTVLRARFKEFGVYFRQSSSLITICKGGNDLMTAVKRTSAMRLHMIESD